jgi:hypothetical protein
MPFSLFVFLKKRMEGAGRSMDKMGWAILGSVWQGSSPLQLWLFQRSPAKRFSIEAVFNIKQRSQSRFGEATNYGFSKTALAPLVMSPTKQTLNKPFFNFRHTGLPFLLLFKIS